MRSTNFEEVERIMRGAFGDVNLRADECDCAGLVIDAVRTPQLTSIKWAMTGISGGILHPGALPTPTLLTGIRLGGTSRMWSPVGQLDCTRPFLYPNPTSFAVERPSAVNLEISRGALDRYARQLTDSSDFVIRFLHTNPVDRPADVLWRNTMGYAFNVLRTLLDVPEPELALAHVTDLVTRMMLGVFPNTATDAIRERDRPYGTAVSRAITFIDDHLADPITITDISTVTGLSRRGLYAAFERELDTSPMQYLKRARLAAAHTDLLSADPARTTVAMIAVRWGFTNPATFAQHYQRTYGRHPRHTLRS